MENLIIVGTNTTADLATEFIKSHNLFNIIGFSVNSEYFKKDTYNGLPVYKLESLSEELKHTPFKIFVAMLWNHLNRERRNVYEYCKTQGYSFANLISPTSIIRGTIEGDNCWINDYVIIQDSAIVKSNVMIMAYSLVGSRVIINEHCFLGARSLIAGNSIVGEQSFIGLSSTVFDDTHIGKKCIVGACTSVKRNLPDYSRVITSADNVVIKQYSENDIENKLVFSKNVR